MYKHLPYFTLPVLLALTIPAVSRDFPSPCDNSAYGTRQCQLNLGRFQTRFSRQPLSDTEVLMVYGCPKATVFMSPAPSGAPAKPDWHELPECRVNSRPLSRP